MLPFNFIFDKTRDDVSILFLKTGYAIFEKNQAKISVSEISGNESDILNYLFNTYLEVTEIEISKRSECECTDFGMTYSFNNTNNFNNIYFGMPYR